MTTPDQLKAQLNQQLQAITDKIADAKGRLPAHSTKPPIMMELLALEDERDEIMAQIEKL